ncbi:hypothetical protein V490_04915 [Pseudogymnoascus sp. VKM F-3557]|nr:hypothetical protein V490_04915 [Pseudogymnoascus sp. VKM F-3557]
MQYDSKSLCKAVSSILEKHRREFPSSSGIGNLTRTISKSMGIRRKSNQQDNSTTGMSPKQNTKHSSSTRDGEALPRTNGHNGSQSSNSTKRQSSAAPSVSQPEASLSPLAQELCDASEQLSKMQKAIQAIATSCIQHADDIAQIPEIQEKYENLRKEVKEKDKTIADLNTAFNFLDQRASEKEKAVANDAKANLAEKERIEREKSELEQQRRAAVEELREKELKLKDENEKVLSRRAAELDKERKAQMNDFEIDMDKRKKEQDGRVRNLEEKNKKALEKIVKLNGQIDRLRYELKAEVGNREDIDKAKEGYKRDKEELAGKLEDLQKEFSLKSKPLEYYQREFLDISQAIQRISLKYLAKKLSHKDVAKLSGVVSDADSTFSDVPFTNSETSKQLRIAHTQRVISGALYKTIWQPFSSDVTASDSALSNFLEEIGAAVVASRNKANGSSGSVNVWRSVTIHALESMSTANTQLQNSSSRLGKSSTIGSREGKLIEHVLSILGPLLDRSVLLQFQADLQQLAKKAIAVWTSAQADERTFTINATLNQDNKSDWKAAVFDYVPLYDSSSQEVVVSKSPNAANVFTLFPIITAAKPVQVQKVGHGPPGSWPDQDKQQASDAEVTLIHEGLGLPQESEIVQMGIEEREEFKDFWLEHGELLAQKFDQKIAGKGHSRNNSTVDTIPGLPSPP